MFENLRNLLKQEAEEENRKTVDFIANGYDNDKERGLRYYLTECKWNKYTAGELDRVKAVDAATKRALKQKAATTEKYMKRIEAAEAAEEVKTVEIKIEWTKSRAWGYNPHAEIIVSTNSRYERFFGSATGCGYDKESAATAEALNQINGLLKALYTLKEQAIIDGKKANARSTSNENYITYGAGYGTLPYFEGGVGIGCHKKMLNMCGLETEAETHGKYFDYYFFKRA